MKTPFKDVLVYFLVGAVIVGGVLGLLDAATSPSAAHGAPGQGRGLASLFINPVANVERMNILLVGCDARVTPDGRHDPGRADTIMLLCISPKNKRIAMFSLPRDFLVTIPQAPKGVQNYPQKINHAYAFGGTPLVRTTVEHALNLKVDYYLKTDLKSFVEATDMLGGVDINVPDIEGGGRGMNYDDSWGNLHIHLKPGLQHLNGTQAMGFVRYRKSDHRNAQGHMIGLTDAERASNQQIFVKSMLEQKAKLSNLPNLMRTGGYVLTRLDTDMEWPTAVGLMQIFRGMQSNALLQLVVPIRDRTIGGVYYCDTAPGEIQRQDAEIAAFLSGATPLAPVQLAAPGVAAVPVKAAPVASPQRALRVKILNGTGVPGAAKRAAQLLRGSTYHIDKMANAARYDYSVTSIQYSAGNEAAAHAAANLLGVAQAEFKPLAGKVPDLLVVLGSDFAPRTAGMRASAAPPPAAKPKPKVKAKVKAKAAKPH